MTRHWELLGNNCGVGFDRDHIISLLADVHRGSGTALGTVGVLLLSYRRLFNERHQVLHQRIRKR